ncbi:MAG: hypothetical protein ORO03_01580 [Alphaproteobacteria bacterium]|nr:hypothetical protein [Alphaproteobacteria bacterium]
MNQKTLPGVWNPKWLLEKLFLVENEPEIPEAETADDERNEPKPPAAELRSALSRLGATDLPEGERFMLDFTTAAKHFGSSWQGLKPRAQLMALRLLTHHYGRDLKYKIVEEGIIFVTNSMEAAQNPEAASQEAQNLVRKIHRQILGDAEGGEAVIEAALQQASFEPKSLALPRLKTEQPHPKPTEGARKFGLTEAPPELEYAEGWEFSEGQEITPALTAQGPVPDFVAAGRLRPELAPSTPAVRLTEGHAIAAPPEFASGWEGTAAIEGDRIWHGTSEPNPKEQGGGAALRLRLLPAESKDSSFGNFQLITQDRTHDLRFKIGLRYGGLLDLQSDVVTTYIADPAEVVRGGLRSPFNSLIARKLSPPRAFALDCLTVDIVGRSLPVLRAEGAQFILAMPINAMTLLRPRLRHRYMERLKRLTESERQLIRPMIYGLEEITPGGMHEILGLLRGITRSPFVRIAPETDRFEVLINQKSFGAMIDGRHYAAYLKNLTADGCQRLVRLAKIANLRLVLYNPANLEQLRWAIAQGFDFVQIATMDGADEIPRVLTRIDRRGLFGGG